jgi:hypothetical protein
MPLDRRHFFAAPGGAVVGLPRSMRERAGDGLDLCRSAASAMSIAPEQRSAGLQAIGAGRSDPRNVALTPRSDGGCRLMRLTAGHQPGSGAQ